MGWATALDCECVTMLMEASSSARGHKTRLEDLVWIKFDPF